MCHAYGFKMAARLTRSRELAVSSTPATVFTTTVRSVLSPRRPAPPPPARRRMHTLPVVTTANTTAYLPCAVTSSVSDILSTTSAPAIPSQHSATVSRVAAPIVGSAVNPSATGLRGTATAALSTGTSDTPSSSNSSSHNTPSNKVLCVCGATINDGRPMVECMSCKAWSHLQCVHLTQRTAKTAKFQCHNCKPTISNKTSISSSKRQNVKVSRPCPKLRTTQALSKSSSSLITTMANSHQVTECVTSVGSCLPVVDSASGNNAPVGPIVSVSAGTSDSTGHPIVSGGVGNNCVVHHQPSQPHSAFVTKDEVDAMLHKQESSIRAELNVRLLALEEEVARLSQFRHHGKRVKGHSQSSQPFSSSAASHYSHSQSSSTSLRRSVSNTLPYRVVWGTSRGCSSQVIQKAVSALLPASDRNSVNVRRSVRHRGTKSLWWFTIMAPSEVIQRIEEVWHILEMKTSWSLRSSLSSRISCAGQPALGASRPTAPATSTTPSSSPSSLNSLNPSASIAQSAVPGPGPTDAQCLSIPVPTVPPTTGSSTVMNCDPGSGLPEATALLGTSADTDVADMSFLDLSSVPLTQELPLEAVAPEVL